VLFSYKIDSLMWYHQYSHIWDNMRRSKFNKSANKMFGGRGESAVRRESSPSQPACFVKSRDCTGLQIPTCPTTLHLNTYIIRTIVWLQINMEQKNVWQNERIGWSHSSDENHPLRTFGESCIIVNPGERRLALKSDTGETDFPSMIFCSKCW